MSTPELLLQTLRAEMRRAGLTYRALAGRVGMSESSIKRVFSQGDMILSRLAQFCQAAEVSLHEVLQQALQTAPETDRLTLEQERSLVAEPVLLLRARCVRPGALCVFLGTALLRARHVRCQAC